MGPWAHGVMGPWAHGPMGLWAFVDDCVFFLIRWFFHLACVQCLGRTAKISCFEKSLYRQPQLSQCPCARNSFWGEQDRQGKCYFTSQLMLLSSIDGNMTSPTGHEMLLPLDGSGKYGNRMDVISGQTLLSLDAVSRRVSPTMTAWTSLSLPSDSGKRTSTTGLPIDSIESRKFSMLSIDSIESLFSEHCTC